MQIWFCILLMKIETNLCKEKKRTGRGHGQEKAKEKKRKERGHEKERKRKGR